MLFPFVAAQPRQALGVLLLAGASDVLDGWAARRHRAPGEEDGPHRGDWLDPLCDKIFVGAVVLGVYLAHRPLPALLLLTLTREALQLISMALYKTVPSLRQRTGYRYRANALGKLTTVVQFVTMGLFTIGHPASPALAVTSALLGLSSVGSYLNRVRHLPRTAS